MFHDFLEGACDSDGTKTAYVTLRSVNKTRVRRLILELFLSKEYRFSQNNGACLTMKTAALSRLFSASATRTKSDFLSRYRVFRQAASTLVSGCHFGDLMGARLAVSTTVSSANRIDHWL